VNGPNSSVTGSIATFVPRAVPHRCLSVASRGRRREKIPLPGDSREATWPLRRERAAPRAKPPARGQNRLLAGLPPLPDEDVPDVIEAHVRAAPPERNEKGATPAASRASPPCAPFSATTAGRVAVGDRAIGYVRVSRVGRAGLELQRESIERVCQRDVSAPCVGNCDESHHPHEVRAAPAKQSLIVRECQVEIARAENGGKSRCHLLSGRERDA
jgi:hypothetical protein